MGGGGGGGGGQASKDPECGLFAMGLQGLARLWPCMVYRLLHEANPPNGPEYICMSSEAS